MGLVLTLSRFLSTEKIQKTSGMKAFGGRFGIRETYPNFFATYVRQTFFNGGERERERALRCRYTECTPAINKVGGVFTRLMGM